ncbi:MAG TPA: NAD-dependent epimerase/dehydratase family protein [Solirubrobacteraceae bacterium]|nr:NAD-dependent epimerase/dehydratase family protein [Solirubrobacteraceae bacterium]
MADSGGTVLVTGGTGFLGGWCIASLLERGYDVRTTIRDLSREPAVRDAVAAAGVQADSRLTVTAADLGSDAGWPEAVNGCRYVLHVASPFPPVQPKDPDELIVPARDGALRVLGAALEAGVERVAMTSSIAAIHPARQSSEAAPYTEDDWTDGQDSSRTPYVRSKTLAEQAAWQHVRGADAEDRLATINPGAIIGPTLSDDHSYSLQVVQRLLGGMPAIPRLGFTFVDVRDVADLHIRALTSPAAGGERFIATDRFLWMPEAAAILRERLGEAAKGVPTRVAPNLLIRAMALFDGSIRSVVSDLGRRSWFSSQKARSELGWTTRPIGDSIEQCARSLL